MRKSILVLALSTLIVGCSAAKPSQEELIRQYYLQETATLVSPHHLRKAMMKGKDDFILVDLRSAEEFNRERIRGAVNIPAYSSPRKSAYGDVERIVGAFKALPKNKEIIVYCYSEPCMTGRKIGKILADHGMYVRHLGVGWNEWRHHWTAWNHEHEWSETNVQDYVESSSALGSLTTSPPEDSGLTCAASEEIGC